MTTNSEATENYVKAVYQLTRSPESPVVASGKVARRLGVAPATATLMLKRLAEAGLLRYEAYTGVSLTPEGTSLALSTLRRHRLIELFLAETLDMPWDLVHDEAERMEHAVSNELIERIDKFLGRPDVDPHGSPIPRDDGSLPRGAVGVPLDACKQGARFTVQRVSQRSGEFLRYLSEIGLERGAHGRVLSNCELSDTVQVRVSGRELSLSRKAAHALQVEER